MPVRIQCLKHAVIWLLNRLCSTVELHEMVTLGTVIPMRVLHLITATVQFQASLL